MKDKKSFFFSRLKKGLSMPSALYSLLFVLCLMPCALDAAYVSKTADTAAAAKSLALASARRAAFEEIVGGKIAIPDKDLANLVETESIENEKVSATGYSADIVVGLDKAAVSGWLAKNNLQPVYQEPAANGERAAAVFESVGGLREWTAVERAARASGADLRIAGISDGKISATVRAGARTTFMAAIRSEGMSVSDYGGTITIR